MTANAIDTQAIRGLALPSVGDVGQAIYHRAWLDRRRAAELVERAVQLQADVSAVRQPLAWAELHSFVVAMRAIVSQRRLYLRKSMQRRVLRGQGPEAYAKFMGLS